MEVIGALFTGLAVGALFAYLNFPIPAPPKLAGVMGIVGIYLGFLLVENTDRIVELASFIQ